MEDAALWESAGHLSSLVEGISSIAESSGREERPTASLIAGLESEAERAEGLVACPADGATALSRAEYISVVLAFLSFVMAVLSYANDFAQPDHGPEIIERLDRVGDSLARSAERADAELLAVEVVVARRNVNMRQGPTTRSKVVGILAPGDKAVVKARTETWAAVEFIEPLSGATKRGWLYGKLVATLNAP